MPAKFKVTGTLDGCGRIKNGTVIIDRNAGTFSVRPYRSHKTYTTSLSAVADIIVERIIKAEMRIAEKAKRERKRTRTWKEAAQ